MVLDNRAKGFVEVNSNLKRTSGTLNSIRNYIRPVVPLKLQSLEVSNETDTSSTGTYVRNGKKQQTITFHKGNSSKEDGGTNGSTTRSMIDATMPLNRSEIKIKKEAVDSGIQLAQKQTVDLSETNEMDSDSVVDMLDSSMENEYSTDSDDDSAADTVKHNNSSVSATVNVSKRPWSTGGSRKKLKQYYTDIVNLKAKMEQSAVLSSVEDEKLDDYESNAFNDDGTTLEEGSARSCADSEFGDDIEMEESLRRPESGKNISQRVEGVGTSHKPSGHNHTKSNGHTSPLSQTHDSRRNKSSDTGEITMDEGSTRPGSETTFSQNLTSVGGNFRPTEHQNNKSIPPLPCSQSIDTNGKPTANGDAARNERLKSPESGTKLSQQVNDVRTERKAASQHNTSKKSDPPSSQSLDATGNKPFVTSDRTSTLPVRDTAAKQGSERSGASVAQGSPAVVSFGISNSQRVFPTGHRSTVSSRFPEKTTSPSTDFRPDFRSNSRPNLMVIAKSSQSIKNTISKRGQTMIERDTLLITSIKCEFNIPGTVTEYNIRAQFLKLLTLFRRQDNTVRIQAHKHGSGEWTDFATLPEDESFGHAFGLVTREFRNHKKIIVHCNVVSARTFNSIKYATEVKEHIFSNNIWLKVDRYESKAEGSPGFFVRIHPKLTHREEFTEELRLLLDEHGGVHRPNSNDSDVQMGGDEETPKAGTSYPPSFHLEASQKKWGNVKTDILRVTCAMDDAEFLKTRFTVISESGKLRAGVFVPVGIHLMTGADTMTNILIDHEKYINDIRGIPITGIRESTMNGIFTPEQKITLRTQLLGIGGVISLEKTRDTAYSGKWIILTTSREESNVLRLVTQQLGTVPILPSGPSPIITVGRQNIRTTDTDRNIINTYAGILARKYSPPVTTRPGAAKPAKAQVTDPVLGKHRAKGAGRDNGDSGKNGGTVASLRDAEQKLLNRVNDIETKWRTLEERYDRKQHEVFQVGKAALAEQIQEAQLKLQTDLVTQVDQKLDAVTKTHEEKFLRLEESVLKQVDKKFNDKVDVISMEVAHLVTMKLTEVLLKRGTSSEPELSPQNPVTQESPLPIASPNGIPSKKLNSPVGLSSLPVRQTSVSQSTVEMDIDHTHTNRSSHDATLERGFKTP